MSLFFFKSNKKYYSRSEIALHNSKESLWIISNNKVYDITSYYNKSEHPGGTQILLSHGGGKIDCSNDFNFHSQKTQNHIHKTYFIGYVSK